MLVELGLVEQRLRAVLEVLNDGASVSDVARRYGVARQTVHRWLRRYASGGLPALADGSSRPATCPHQMEPELEVWIVEMRRTHPTWGPRTILNRLARHAAGAIEAVGLYREAGDSRVGVEPLRRGEQAQGPLGLAEGDGHICDRSSAAAAPTRSP